MCSGWGWSQVVLTMLVATAGHAAAGGAGCPPLWRLSWQTALALSGALAMSSTAIVVKLMAERLELESEHGKRVMGVLLFQDLAVVPLLVLIPALGSPPEVLLRALGIAAVKAAVLIALLLVGGQRVMRWWLTLVARRKSEELFVLNLLLVTLGLAWLTELAGPVAGAGRLHRRHADFRDRIQAPGGNRHPALPRRAAGPVLHHHRHAAGLAAGVRALAAGAACC